MKVYREWRISGRHRAGCARCGRACARASTTASPPGTRGARASSRSRTTTPTTSSSGAPTACAPASTSARWRRRSPWARRWAQDVSRYRERLASRHAARSRPGALQRRVLLQKVEWKDLSAPSPLEVKAAVGAGTYSPEARVLLEKEGPKYQYGTGCLSDGVLGAWMAEVCGVPVPIDPAKVTSHLEAVHRYNFQRRPERARQPAAADLCLRQRGRPAAVHLAAGRRSRRCRSCTATRSGRASSTRWRRT